MIRTSKVALAVALCASLLVSATAEAAPTYSSSFGSEGSGDGQFKHPGDVAVDAAGSLWVVDQANSRIEKFSETGEFLAKFGAAGSGKGQLSGPSALALDAAATSGSPTPTTTGSKSSTRRANT